MIRQFQWHVLTGLMVAGLSAQTLAQDIRCEKYKLDNGLTVILHEDHSLPVASINLWYRVGSKDEPPRRSGFAHLFEHLMFMGTRRVPGSGFDDVMEAAGGANNATTSTDRTNYFSSGPARLLPTLLWLDADRLEDLGRTMDKVKLDRQRDVVRNERRQSYENRPYGMADLKLYELMYPQGHPYHIPVIGTHEDLEAATVSDVQEFFANYYVPNNCSLCVAGDFNPAEIRPLIERLFGSLQRGLDPSRRTAAPVRLDGVRRLTLVDDVQLPLVTFVYHSPAEFAPGDAELDLLADLLADGKTSRLYKRLVYDDRLAVEVAAAQEQQQLGSLFQVQVFARPDADLNRIEAVLDEELARIVKDGPTPAELARVKSQRETAMLARLQTIEARADALNRYEYFFGDPNGFRRDMERYRTATETGVRQQAAAVLTPDARLIMRVIPKAPEPQASPRDEQPKLADVSAFTPIAPTQFALRNGIRVWLWNKPELPLVAVSLRVNPGRPINEPATAGLCDLAATMLGEGAGERDALQFDEAMQALGASFDTAADQTSLGASLFVLKRNFEPAAALMADALLRPRLQPADWDRIKKLHLDDLRQQDEEPTIIAGRVAARTLFGEAHPYGMPVEGTPETVEPLTLEQARATLGRWLNPKFATLLVAGDLTEAEAKSTLDQLLGDWSAPSADAEPAATMAVAEPRTKLGVYLVDRPGAVQTVVRFIMPGPRYDDPRRVPLRLMNVLLGGSFTSRLNRNLREQHGYTYGARCNFTMDPSVGYFTAAASVQSKVTGPAVTEFLKELRGIRRGDVSAEELTKARETIQTDLVQSFAGLSGVLGVAAEFVSNGREFAELGKDLAALRAATDADLNKLAGPAIPLEQGALILVGDGAEIRAQLRQLTDLPEPVELDVRGRPKASNATVGHAG